MPSRDDSWSNTKKTSYKSRFHWGTVITSEGKAYICHNTGDCPANIVVSANVLLWVFSRRCNPQWCSFIHVSTHAICAPAQAFENREAAEAREKRCWSGPVLWMAHNWCPKSVEAIINRSTLVNLSFPVSWLSWHSQCIQAVPNERCTRSEARQKYCTSREHQLA